ncbi:Uncharacterised protein [Candidatus Gugararchaeum adminiculabundum]|nr:Uncharacterised protein [Candidatus Gugararchaeum adminiculabundum]
MNREFLPFSRVKLENGVKVEYRICIDVDLREPIRLDDQNMVTLVSATGLSVLHTYIISGLRKAVIVNDRQPILDGIKLNWKENVWYSEKRRVNRNTLRERGIDVVSYTPS